MLAHQAPIADGNLPTADLSGESHARVALELDQTG